MTVMPILEQPQSTPPEQAVYKRYAHAAGQVEAALCCPVAYDRNLLAAIPSEILEAASIDGAGAWQRFRHITLPLLGPTIRISVFLSIIGSIQLFDLVWVMTSGGPNHSSETMAIAMFQFGFKRYQVGYASAISVVLFMISLVFSLFYQRYVLRRDLSGAVTSGGGR